MLSADHMHDFLILRGFSCTKSSIETLIKLKKKNINKLAALSILDKVLTCVGVYIVLKAVSAQYSVTPYRVIH